MRNLAIGVLLVLLAASSANAVGLGDLVQAAQIIRGLGVREYQPEPVTSTSPEQNYSFRADWKDPGVIDASGGYGYGDGWGQFGFNSDRIRSFMSAAGQQVGILILTADSQAKSTQDRTAQPGYDPRYAPRQGLMRGPQGLIQATVTFGGYYCHQEARVDTRHDHGRWMREEYRTVLEVVVYSVETLEPIASAKAEGSSAATFYEGELERGGFDLGGLMSRRARPDQAIEAAANSAMSSIVAQLSAKSPTNPGKEVVVAGVEGPQVVVTTTDGSDIRDAGIVEGFTYAVRGAAVINPVTGQRSRGVLKICTIRITTIDADLAQALIVADSASGAATIGDVLRKGDRVTLEPYQSLFAAK